MRREKQIEGMAEILRKVCEPSLLDECDSKNCNECMAEAIYNAGYRKQSGWISVDERLPDNDWGKHWKERKYYLVFTKPSGLMNVAVYGYKEHDWWIDRNSCVLDKKNYKEVTHWMPLPEPPDMKGGSE